MYAVKTTVNVFFVLLTELQAFTYRVVPPTIETSWRLMRTSQAILLRLKSTVQEAQYPVLALGPVFFYGMYGTTVPNNVSTPTDINDISHGCPR